MVMHSTSRGKEFFSSLLRSIFISSALVVLSLFTSQGVAYAAPCTMVEGNAAQVGTTQTILLSTNYYDDNFDPCPGSVVVDLTPDIPQDPAPFTGDWDDEDNQYKFPPATFTYNLVGGSYGKTYYFRFRLFDLSDNLIATEFADVTLVGSPDPDPDPDPDPSPNPPIIPNDTTWAQPNPPVITSFEQDAETHYGENLSMAVGSDGMSRFVHMVFGPGGDSIVFERCLDEECTTRSTVEVEPYTNWISPPKIVLINDLPHISYLERTNDGGVGPKELDLVLHRCADIDCSSITRSVVVEGETSFPSIWHHAMALGEDGFLRFVYLAETTYYPTFLRCTNATCTTYETSVITTATTHFAKPEMVLDRGDFAHMIYHDLGSGGRIMYVVCDDLDCDTSTTTTIESSIGTSPRFLAIALSQSDNAYLLWSRHNDDVTRYSQCANRTCSTRNTITIDSEESGWGIAMTVAGNGLPILATTAYRIGAEYPLGYIGVIKVTQCLNALCQYRKTTDIIPMDEDAGNYTHIGVRPDGRVNIGAMAYVNDYEESYIIHIRCGNYTCDDSVPQTYQSAVGDPIPSSTVLGVPGNGASLYGGMSVVENDLGYGTTVYADNDADELVAVYCTSRDCHNPTRTILNTEGADWVHAVMKVNDMPSILYSIGGEMRLIVCTTVECSTFDTHLIDDQVVGYDVHDVDLDNSGGIHMLYVASGNIRYGYCASVDCSDFTTVVLDAGSTNDGNLALGADGFMHVAYELNNNIEYVRCTNSSCSTRTTATPFVDETYFVTDVNAEMPESVDIVVTADGFARIVYSAYIDDNWAYSGIPNIFFLRCTNADCTTSETITLDDNYFSGEWVRMGLNTAGNPVVVYHSDPDSQYGIRIAECRNTACTSMDRSILVHGLDLWSGWGHKWGFSIDVGATAVHVVSEHHFSSSSPTQVEYFYYNQTNRKYPLTSFIDDWTGGRGQSRGKAGGPTIVVGSDGLPRMVHLDNMMGAVLFNRCYNLECTWKHWQTVDQNGSYYEMTALALTDSDLPRILYSTDYNSSTVGDENLRLIRCADELCETRTNSMLVDTGEDIRNFQMALEPTTDIPYVLYHGVNGNNGTVYFLACNDSACTSPTTTTIGTTFIYGPYQPGLALGADGFARFTYWDIDGDFHFVQCTNATCSTREDTVVYTSPTTDDFYPESVIRIGADGYARVAFLDTNGDYNGTVQYMRCLNDSCSTNTIVDVSTAHVTNAGWEIGMDLGLNDIPFFGVYYMDPVYNSGMVFISCDDTACTNTESTTLRSPLASSFYHTAEESGVSWHVDVVADDAGNPLILHTNTIRNNWNDYITAPVDAGTVVNNQYLELIICDKPTCATSALFTGSFGAFNILSAIVSSGQAGAEDVSYQVVFDEVEGVGTGYVLRITFPDAFEDAIAALVAGDVTITGTNLDSGASTVTIDPATNSISIELVTTDILTEDLTVSINNITNPPSAGIYGLGLRMFDEEEELLAQGAALFSLYAAVDVRAVVTEALILTLSNMGVTLQVDPALNDGQDISQQTTLDVASNASGGYVVYARLDDGTGAAGLRSLLGDVISSTLAEGDNYIGYTGRNDGVGASASAEHAFSSTPAPVYDSAGDALGFTDTTDGQLHTVNYDVNVNFLTPAGIYVGTVFYTVVPRF